jgi:sterol desaturase/sphingolipid hydroxylase (fatty acid hydroxylase superfamily)
MVKSDEPGQASLRQGYKPEPIQSSPVFRWPPQTVAVLRWFLGFPGFLWPWPAFFFVLAVVCQEWLTPVLFDAGGLLPQGAALVFLRNSALLVAFVSLWHVHLYVSKAQGTSYKYDHRWPFTDDRVFLFRSQLWDNVFWTVCAAVPIWTAYELVTVWLQTTGFSPATSWTDRPTYCLLLLLATPVWLQTHFYITHRLIHWKPLYKSVHYIHHKNVNPGPWSGLAMHPIEHLIYFSAIIPYWFIPTHPTHTMYALLFLALGASMAHHGFHKVKLAGDTYLPTDHYMHYLHHKYVSVNFSVGGLLPLDKWLNTFHDGSDSATEELKRRTRERILLTRRKQGAANQADQQSL